MAELNKYSTINDVIQSYRENASYEEDNSVEKARRFVTAIRYMLGSPKRAKKGGSGGAEDEYDHEVLRAELLSAKQWADRNGDRRPHVIDVNFEEFDARR